MILIDLPIPEACDVCPFNYDFCWCNAFVNDDEWKKYSDDWNENVCERTTRPEYCPLKEHEEVVRCRDCKYCNKDDYVCEHPNEWGNEDTRNQRNLDWFCADGVRKDG